MKNEKQTLNSEMKTVVACIVNELEFLFWNSRQEDNVKTVEQTSHDAFCSTPKQAQMLVTGY